MPPKFPIPPIQQQGDPLAQMGQAAMSPVTPTQGLTPEQIRQLMVFLQAHQGEQPPTTSQEANPDLPVPPSQDARMPTPMPNAPIPDETPDQAEKKFRSIKNTLGGPRGA